jgi:hypothetical protein
MKIQKITIKVNGNTTYHYKIEGNEEKIGNTVELFRKIFKNQGELYKKIYNVDWETAYLAGWHPDCGDFHDNCYGWRKFKKEKGKIQKEVITEEWEAEEFIRNYLGF